LISPIRGNSIKAYSLIESIVNTENKQERLAELRAEVAELERELNAPPKTWKPSDAPYYGFYHATAGLMLGIVGAIASLLFNIVGSLAIGQNPLRLIQVYLTFGLGESALSPEFDTGMAMAIGCCLYIGTGMLLGIPFQMAIAKFFPDANLSVRLMFATALGLILWAVNFYLVLSWLQPALFGGDWIVDPKILPPWVGAATHVVFAWTMACIYPWGRIGEGALKASAVGPQTST